MGVCGGGPEKPGQPVHLLISRLLKDINLIVIKNTNYIVFFIKK